jgi:aminobenzoyl-glutamate utilization protein B
MEFEQGTNYANVLPNDTLAEVLGRAMQKAGGYEYTPEERKFADEMQKTLGAPCTGPAPRR